MGRALSARSCTGQTHVGAVSPRSTNQLHDGAMAGKHLFFRADGFAKTVRAILP